MAVDNAWPAQDEETSRQILEEAPIGFFRSTPGGRYLSVNRAMASILGYAEPNELIQAVSNISRQVYVTPESRTDLLKILEQQSQVTAFEVPLFRKDGSVIWVSKNVSAVRDTQGKVVYYQGFAADISELKHVEQVLFEREQRIRGMLNATSDAVFLLDRAGVVLEINVIAARRCDTDIDTMLGKPIYDFLPPKAASRRRIELHKVFSSKRMVRFEEERSGRIFALRMFPVFDGFGQVAQVASFSRDITERKHAEEQLKRSTELAEAARIRAEAANNAKNEFLANMSHELRTPLNGILGMLQLMETTEPSAEQSEYIQIAKKSSRRLTNLLTDILDMAQIEAGKTHLFPAPFHPAHLAEELGDLFSSACREKGLQLDIHLDESVPVLLVGDVKRIRQVIFNLTANAVKYTNTGSVRVEVSSLKAPSPGQCLLHVMVADTGIGIPLDKQDAIFESFIQADGSYSRKYEGAGLGLALVKRFMEMMRGSITLDSAPDQGSSFHFVLPLSLPSDKSVAPDPSPAAVTAAPERSLKILLAEDDDINRVAARLQLRKMQHRTVAVKNGLEALKELEREAFDLVLMDIQMPVMNGVEALRIIRGHDGSLYDPNIPVIAVTAYALNGDREALLAEGMNDYLAKPVREKDLRNALRAWM